MNYIENEKGMLVKSTAGHDSESWYAVVKAEEGFVYIADGRRRKVAKPKRKNVKHIINSDEYILLYGLTDKKLRKALWDRNFNNAQSADIDEER